MPRATYRYPFELTVLHGCCALAERLSGAYARGHGFHAAFDAEGNLLAAHCEPREPRFRELPPEGRGMLLYDPFEGPEATWVEWSGFTPAMMERALALRFAPDAFDASGGFPDAHAVMF